MKNLLHHVNSMDNSLSDSIFRLIGCAMWLVGILLPLVARDVLQLVSLLFKKLVNFLLVLYDSLGDDLPVLNYRSVTRVS